MAQIEIQNLSFWYPNETDPAVKNVSLEVEKGSYVALCGKSGSGKSTLLRCLKPELRPFGKTSGDIFFDNQKIAQIEGRISAQKIGFVMQSPEHQIVTDKVWHELAFGLENLGFDRNEIRARVAEIAEYFGITDWYDSDIERLSGGQKQLLNLAAVMVMNPEALILDEPTAQLNPIAAERFLEMVKKINEDFEVTIILSEHRLENVLPDADRLVIMEQAQIVSDTTVEETFKQHLNGAFMKLMPAAAQIAYRIEQGGGEQIPISVKQGGGEQIPISVKQGREWLRKKAAAQALQLHNDRREMKKAGKKEEKEEEKKEKKKEGKPAVSVKNVWFRYERGGKDIIKNLCLEVARGDIYAILGGNGTGKTTMMSLLCEINRPYRGKIRVEGTTAYLPQDVQTLFFRNTVRQELDKIPQKWIDLMELEPFMEKHPYDLSGGQQQKLGLCKILATDADILLLDEPTKGIDAIYKEQMGQILRELKAQGKTIILVSHDIDFCGEYADFCGLFANGNVVSSGSASEFFQGSRFYTTTVRKITQGIADGIINKEELLCCFRRETTISFR